MTAVGPTTVTVGLHLAGADAAAVRRSLPTVVAQTWDAVRVVAVVDAATTDETSATFAAAAASLPDTTTITRRAPVTRAAARDLVLATTDGGVLAWMTVGAVWAPRRLELLLGALADHPGPTLATGPHGQPGAVGDHTLTTPTTAGDELLRAVARGEHPLPVAATVGAAATYREIGGFDTGLVHRDDDDLLLRFLRSGGTVAATGAVGTLGVLPPEPSEASSPRAADLAAERRRLRRAHRDVLRHDGDGRHALERLAQRYADEGAPLAAAWYRARARVAGPRPRDDGERRTRRVASPPVEAASATAGSAPDTGTSAATMRPVEEAATRGDFATAVAAWRDADERDRVEASGHTVELVARALRATGEHVEAVRVAQRAASRWPDHRGVLAELAKNRAVLTDWAASAVVSAPDPAAADIGEVTDLGVLVGRGGAVRGWVARGATRAPEVSVAVGGRPVISTYAADHGDGRRVPFSLRCDQLLEFLGDGDVVTITSANRRLGIGAAASAADRSGTELRITTGGPSRMPDLHDRVARGHVFTKFGKLRPGHSPGRKRRILALFDEVAEVVADRYGYVCTPFYGNLLGTVREQDFIAHDVGGFDAGFVSDARDPAGVRAEVVEVALRLLARGFHLEVEPFGVMVRHEPGDQVFVDLNYAWFGPGEQLQLAYGWRHEPVRGRDRVLAPRDGYLAGRLVPVPADAENVLTQVYGPTWPVPDQGYDPVSSLRRDERYLLHAPDVAAVRAAAPDRVQVLTPPAP